MLREMVIVAVMILALYGIADLIQRLAFRLLYGKGKEQFLLVPATGENDGGEYAARRLLATHRFLPPCDNTRLLLVCYGSVREGVSRLCDLSGIKICAAKDLQEILRSSLQSTEKEL